MKLYTDPSPLAVTAPLVLNHRVLLGLARSIDEVWCEDLSWDEFTSSGVELYLSPRVPTTYFGLKAVWEFLDELHLDTPIYDYGEHFIQDARLMAFLLDPDSAAHERNYDGFPVKPRLHLHHVAHRYLGWYSPYLTPELSKVRLDELLAREAGWIFSLGEKLPLLMDSALWKLYRNLEIPFQRVLYEMGRIGIGFDGARGKGRGEAIRAEWDEISKVRLGGAESVDELYEKLEDAGVRVPPPRPKDKRALREALEDYKGEAAIISPAIEWLRLGEDLDFLEKWSGHDRLHPVWGQCSSATSRVYARNPSVQTLRRDLRKFFVPAEGCVLVKADYSQAQLRILAHLSGDPELHRVFHDPDGDVHRSTAEALGLKERREAKEVNFGICFGMGPESLARKLGEHVTVEQAQSYIDGFNAKHPRIEAFFAERWGAMKEDPPNQRTVRSPAGRLRRFGSYPTTKVERRFRATWTQQIEADLIKTAMVRLDTIFRRRGMKAQLVMMIHDSIWVECPKDEEVEVKRLMERMMVTAGKLDVPLKVDFE